MECEQKKMQQVLNCVALQAPLSSQRSIQMQSMGLLNILSDFWNNCTEMLFNTRYLCYFWQSRVRLYAS